MPHFLSVMNLKVCNGDKTIELTELDLDSRVGIFTGTFDPIHQTHIDIAKATLRDSLGKLGNDYVLFYVHSFTLGKAPAPESFRQEVINEFIRDQENMALIYLENASSDSLLKPRELIQYLITTYSMSLTRIIGSDKVSEASKHNGQMPHFVHNRDGSIQIPSNFISLNLPPGISSTQLRSGEIPFDRQYGKFSRGIGTHYPNSRMI